MLLTTVMKHCYHWLLPPTCLLCHAATTTTLDLCQRCAEDLPRLPPGCPRCAQPLTVTATACGECLRQPPAYDGTYALFAYQTPITKLIMELKFHQLLVNAAVLGRLLADALQAHGHYSKSLPDVILPVPLHRERLSERGFNQALEIARPISKILQIPIAIQSAERTRHTAAQARLNAEKRGQNLRNAFKIRTNVAGLHIAILDDVITTGRTVESLSRALKAAGAKRVDVWAVARAILNG